MEAEKQIGIWMDHAHAHIMELNQDTIVSNLVTSDFTHEQREESLSRSENIMHNKEQGFTSTYYKKIIEAVKDCKNIMLFGPTTAKSELFNLLKDDHHFENSRIDVKSTDNLTENQQHAFVRHYFQYQLK